MIFQIKIYTDFKTKDELINYIKTKKENLDKHLDTSGYAKRNVQPRNK